jgi:TonB family protein
VGSIFKTLLAGAVLAAGALAGSGVVAQPADGPVWTRRPSQAELERNYPSWSAAGAGGSVALRCKVAANGTLTDCAVAAETPAGLGFGGAAMNVARNFRMKPMSMAGRPVAGATVLVPVVFELAGGSPAPPPNIHPGDAAILVTLLEGAPPKRAAVIPCPSQAAPERRCLGHSFDWRSRPPGSRVSRLLRGSGQQAGISLLECSAGPDGRLSACKVGGDATEQSKAALIEMAGLFRAPGFARDSTSMGSGRVLIEIDWSLVDSWTPAG